MKVANSRFEFIFEILHQNSTQPARKIEAGESAQNNQLEESNNNNCVDKSRHLPENEKLNRKKNK